MIRAQGEGYQGGGQVQGEGASGERWGRKVRAQG